MRSFITICIGVFGISCYSQKAVSFSKVEKVENPKNEIVEPKKSTSEESTTSNKKDAIAPKPTSDVTTKESEKKPAEEENKEFTNFKK